VRVQRKLKLGIAPNRNLAIIGMAKFISEAAKPAAASPANVV
jgi:hypothetical protein